MSKEIFVVRSKSRMRIAYIFLFCAFGVLVYGTVQVIKQLNNLMEDVTKNVTPNFADKKFDLNKDGNIDECEEALAIASQAPKTFGPYEIGNFLARLVLVTVIFYIGNIFIRLYKYNMGVSDYYIACADSIDLAKEFDNALLKKFISAFTTITTSKVEFEIPSDPKIEIPKINSDKSS